MSTQSRLLRGVAVIGVVMVAAGAIAPAFSAKAPATKKQVKKTVRKLGDKLFLAEDEFIRLDRTTMSTGDTPDTLFEIGPFTVKGDCDLVGGDVVGTTTVETSENDAVFESYSGTDDYDFDAADGAVEWWTFTGNPPGGLPDTQDPEHDGAGSAWARSGAGFSGIVRILTNFGAHCVFDGHVVDLS